jgi:RNA polymerase sigma factor (sigma-70 family)
MASGPVSKVLRQLRRSTLLREARRGDGQLLRDFIERGDEDAFAALLHRHGPMVLGVCRRVLPSLHDAEDAFQATFLVLVRKAGSISPPEKVGSWLYGVAYQVAVKARALGARLRARERQVVDLPEPAAPAAEPGLGEELRPLIDRELSRLPDKYRLPVVLCDLEGKTRRQAAGQLGWPEGTVAGRLARARKKLAARLSRRGVVLTAGMLAGLLADRAAPAALPPPLAASTLDAVWRFAVSSLAGGIPAPVLTLTQGVLKTMLLGKVKLVTTIVLAVALAGAGLGMRLRSAAEEPASSKDNNGTITHAAEPNKAARKLTDEERLEQKLNKAVQLNFKDATLRRVLEDVRAFATINLFVDEPALNRQGISLDMHVTIQVEDVSLRTALKLVLQSHGLRYFIQDGVVVVTTVEPPIPKKKVVMGLTGSWKVLCCGGEKGMVPHESLSRQRWRFSEHGLDIEVDRSRVGFECRWEKGKTENRIGLSLLGQQRWHGRYVLDGDTLVLWMDTPLTFLDAKKSAVSFIVLKHSEP